MKIQTTSFKELFQVEFDKIQLLILCNTLNEVCNGIRIENFYETIGSNKIKANFLLDRVESAFELIKIQKIPQLILLDLDYIKVLQNAMIVVMRELHYPGEYFTRIGGTIDEAKMLLGELNRLIDDIEALQSKWMC